MRSTYAAIGYRREPPSTLPGLGLLLTYLSALGWRVGETLEVVDRQAEGDTSKLPHLAAEIVAARPQVIACTSIQEASALRAATTDIPIARIAVLMLYPESDPQGQLHATLARIFSVSPA